MASVTLSTIPLPEMRLTIFSLANQEMILSSVEWVMIA
jgi:hypothetical protein